MSRRDGRKWYQQKRWLLTSLLLFPPLGIPLLWLAPWPQAGKISGSVLSGVILISVLTGEATEPNASTITPSAVKTTGPPLAKGPVQAVLATLPTAYEYAITQATSATKETATAKSIEDWDIVAIKWQRAIASLNDVPLNSNYYSQSQAKIEEYQHNADNTVAQLATVQSAELEAEAISQQRIEEQATQIEASVLPEDNYVSGSCKDLKARGVGSNFTPGDANYTRQRDRDSDGITCES